VKKCDRVNHYNFRWEEGRNVGEQQEREKEDMGKDRILAGGHFGSHIMPIKMGKHKAELKAM
jgi:hypothetical protein